MNCGRAIVSGTTSLVIKESTVCILKRPSLVQSLKAGIAS